MIMVLKGQIARVFVHQANKVTLYTAAQSRFLGFLWRRKKGAFSRDVHQCEL